MPKMYSDEEKKIIIAQLKEEARDCMSVYGIRKTTVDELVKRVHIPKGTFYLLYESKEMLLFDALQEIDFQIHEMLNEQIAKLTKEVTVDSLTDCIYQFFLALEGTCIPKILESGEFEILYRKLPKGILEQHFTKDQKEIQQMFQLIGLKEEDCGKYADAFRAVFLMLSLKKAIGAGDFQEMLYLMLRGLVLQMMEEK